MVKEALQLLGEAREALEANGQGDLLAEVHRLQGTLLLHDAVRDEVEAAGCFERALAMARGQRARSWELRAAVDLARLRQQQGKHREARDLLDPICGWFTEGLDTADLREAQALLAGSPPGRASRRVRRRRALSRGGRARAGAAGRRRWRRACPESIPSCSRSCSGASSVPAARDSGRLHRDGRGARCRLVARAAPPASWRDRSPGIDTGFG
jgi:hypothetical protein